MSRELFIICAPSMGFPEGMAATARVRQYANAFRDGGYEVTVICPAPSEPSVESARNTATTGSVDGIAFWYSSGSTVRASSFVVRRMGAVRSWMRILTAIARVRPTAILVYPMTGTLALLVSPLSRLLGVRMLCDQSELPSVHTGTGVMGRVRLLLKLSGMRHSDGIIAITPVIADHVRPLVHPASVTVIPVIIDTTEFAPSGTGASAEDRRLDIVYTGPLNDHKDGAGTLIRAFAAVHEAQPSTRLVLVGESIPERIERYGALAEEVGVRSAVVFKGRIPRSQLLSVLANAAVLTLPRPDSEQNRANMPTKLVEYLATGRPVVATDVGLVPDMVAPGVEAVVVPAGDPSALATGILTTLKDPEASRMMARSGQRRATSAFDYRAYSEMLDHMARGESEA